MFKEARMATPEALKLPKRQTLDAAVYACLLTTTLLHFSRPTIPKKKAERLFSELSRMAQPTPARHYQITLQYCTM